MYEKINAVSKDNIKLPVIDIDNGKAINTFISDVAKNGEIYHASNQYGVPCIHISTATIMLMKKNLEKLLLGIWSVTSDLAYFSYIPINSCFTYHMIHDMNVAENKRKCVHEKIDTIESVINAFLRYN